MLTAPVKPMALSSLLPAFLAFFILSTSSLSAEERGLKFGLAMHGSPKHTSQSERLEYTSPMAEKGGTVTYAAIGTFDSLNPFAIKGTAANGLHLIYDRLMARAWDEPFTLYPLIARGYEVAEDRSWITFYLNPAARFSDGRPVTVDDVVFSLETLREDGRPNMRRVYDLVDNISHPAPDAVRFDLKDGYDRETVMILAIMPVLSKDFWKDRKFNASILEQPVTSGPYTVAALDPGSRIVFERNPDYWGKDLLANRGLHNYDRIVFDYYRDKNIAYEAFQAGEISFWREDDASRWIRALENNKSKNIISKAFPHKRPERVQALIFNTRRPPFDDIRVRKAMEMAFNAGWINKTLYYDQFKRIDSYFPNSELAATGTPSGKELEILRALENELPSSVFGPAYEPTANKDRRELRKNLREASDLLEKAGWIVKNGERINQKTGEVFEFEVILNDKKKEKIGLALARNLERLGITAKLRVLDSSAFIGRLNSYDYDMVLHFWLSTLSPGTEQILFWGCEAAQQEARWNFAGICNPAIDAISKQIAFSKTREELVVLTRALDRALTHGYYMIPLFYRGEDWVSYQNQLNHPEYTPLYGLVQESWWKSPKNE